MQKKEERKEKAYIQSRRRRDEDGKRGSKCVGKVLKVGKDHPV